MLARDPQEDAKAEPEPDRGVGVRSPPVSRSAAAFWSVRSISEAVPSMEKCTVLAEGGAQGNACLTVPPQVLRPTTLLAVGGDLIPMG